MMISSTPDGGRRRVKSVTADLNTRRRLTYRARNQRGQAEDA
jgi:hypothetical protein